MGKYRVAYATGSRADYGIVKNFLRLLDNDKAIEFSVLVTGSHLEDKFGHSVDIIRQDGFKIDLEIPLNIENDSNANVMHCMATALDCFGNYFENNKFDLLIILGDRYEMMAVAIAAAMQRIPILHLHGGEVTYGNYDEFIRHSITKMSQYHFTSTEEYRKRVIQLGEDPKRVFVSGALGIENIMNINYISKKELEKELNFSLDKPYAVVTYHPVTLENNSEIIQTKEILSACEYFQNYKFIFTKSNADHGGNKINDLIQEYVNNNRKQAVCVASLGAVKYLSALKYASFVMGNSSSGIIEAPSFNIPTINIGDRQRGRVQADSILNCRPERNEIIKCIKETESEKCRAVCENVKNPYGDGKASRKIIDEIKYYIKNNVIDLKKSFYDIEFEQRG